MDNPVPPSKLESLIEEARELKRRHLDSAIRWYQRKAPLPRRLFRTAGYSVIVLSVSLPFLTALEFVGSDLFISFVALLIALLTGASSFAQWDSTWRGYKRAQLSLEGLEALWETRILEARQMDDPDEAIKAVLEATRDLLQSANSVVTAETEQFFEGVKPPQASRAS